MLSAIVVNKQNLEDGTMEPSTLKGFIEAAKWLGYYVDSEEEFLEQQQTDCFAWGAHLVRGGSIARIMAVPDFQSLMLPVLRAAADGEISAADLRERVAASVRLTAK